MATKSGALAIGVGFTQIATALVGEEVVVFGLVFSNMTAAERTVTLRIHTQATGLDVDVPFTLAAKKLETWGKAVGLQPGDTLSVAADAVGVGLLWSVDADDGVNPVSAGLNPRGDYSALATYAVNDYVWDAGKAWVSMVGENTDNPPATSPAEWMALTEVSQTVVDAAVASAMDPFMDDVAAQIATRAPAARAITGAGLLAGQGGDLTDDRVFTVTPATVAQIRAGDADDVVVTPAEQDAALLRVNVADAATIAWDLATAPDGVVTIGGSRLVGAPTGAKADKIYSLLIMSTGAFTPSFDACFDFGENGAGTFPSGAGKYGVLDAECISLDPLKFRSTLWKSA